MADAIDNTRRAFLVGATVAIPSLGFSSASAADEAAMFADLADVPSPSAAAYDTEVASLEAELDAAWAAERAAFATAQASGAKDEDRLNKLWDEAEARTRAVIDRVEAVEVRSLNGAKLKAKAINWCHAGEFEDTALIGLASSRTTDMRLINSLIRDLIAMGAAA